MNSTSFFYNLMIKFRKNKGEKEMSDIVQKIKEELINRCNIYIMKNIIMIFGMIILNML